jgi:hypothetical protein
LTGFLRRFRVVSCLFATRGRITPYAVDNRQPNSVIIRVRLYSCLYDRFPFVQVLHVLIRQGRLRLYIRP